MCTRHKKFVHFTLTLAPQRGLFLSFFILLPFRFSREQSDKSLISVIDNVCHVHSLAPNATGLASRLPRGAIKGYSARD